MDANIHYIWLNDLTYVLSASMFSLLDGYVTAPDQSH